MSRRIIELEKPVLRRIGNLTIRVSRDGIDVRGKGKQKWTPIEWARVLALIESNDRPAIIESEIAIGRRVHSALVARTNKRKGES